MTAGDGSLRPSGRCAFASGIYERCPMYVPESFCIPGDRTASIEKRAAWEDVSAKARAIVDTGGVRIVSEDSQEIEAIVTSSQVSGDFPVAYGGPYNVTLSKRSWENSGNTGGWVQGFLCDCAWGQYNSGQPGGGYHGRFCSHAYAALLESNSRARKDFMGDRKKAARATGICASCGCFDDGVSNVTGNCRECDADIAFEAVSEAFASEECDRSKVKGADPEIMGEIVDSMTVRSAGGDNYLIEWNGRRAMVTKTSGEQYGELFGETSDGQYSYIVDHDGFGNYEVYVHSKDPFDTAIQEQCGTNYRTFDEEHEAVRWGEECMVALDSKEAAAPGEFDVVTSAGKVTVALVGDMWEMYPDEEFAYQFSMDPDPVTGGAFDDFRADDIWEAVDTAQLILSDDWGLSIEDVRMGARIEAGHCRCNKKDATRHFTYAEMLELDREIEGRELHNADRFKA